MEKKRKKVGIALGSGGSRGFCHVGVLQVLEENNIPIDFITGCSMGAMVGGCYCAGIPLATMYDIAIRTNQFAVMDVNLSRNHYGLLKGQRALSKIKPLMGNKTFEECVIPFKATATEIRNGVLKVLGSGKVIDAIRASISIPAAFHAIATPEDEILVDGGILERIPIDACRQMGADVVIAVDALGPITEGFKPDGIIAMIERSFMLMDWRHSQIDNKKADLVITPEQGQRSMFLFKENEYSIQQGREMTEKMLPEILQLIK